jgi:hypothetical protein
LPPEILVVIPRVSGDDDAQLLGVPTDRLALLLGGDVPLTGPSTDSRDAYVPCYRDRVESASGIESVGELKYVH